MRRRVGVAAPSALILAAVLAALPSSAAAHPLGNYTVNRAIVIEIGASVEIRYVVDMAEIPAFEAIATMDLDGDGDVAEEAPGSASERCATVRAGLSVVLDGHQTQPREAATPTLDFPPGAGGLPTLRLECRFTIAERSLVADTEHELTLRDLTDDTRTEWREVTALAWAGGSILASDVPARSETAVLTAYPENRLDAPPDVHAGTVRFRLAPHGRSGVVAGVGGDPFVTRPTASDPLADLVGRGLSPPIVVLALLLSLALGALHALSPGHGKTLVAAYVLGSGGNARSAMLIGLSVAASHTAGVLVLGIVTLLAGQLFVPEQVLAWLSLGSGIVVAGIGALLLVRVLARGGPSHQHDHHDPHHHHDRREHPAPPSGGITRRSALALGFAGGAVPSASAVIVLLVAISTDRLLLGTVLIAAFGIGMAVVLGGLALVVARIGRMASSSSRWQASPVIRRAGAMVPAAAGIAVLVTGITFTLAAVGQLA